MANFIQWAKFAGKLNMDIDRNLLEDSIRNKLSPTLRLYGWSSPTLTLGRNQPLKGINLHYCSENNIDIVKRPTGGRALLHDNELTYCFVVPVDFIKDGQSVIASYKEISEAFIIAFKKLNIELYYPENKKISVKDGYCMAISTGSDLNFQDKKFIGSAQFRSQGYILQHGSIVFDINNEALSNIFNLNNPAGNLITVNEINLDLDINTLSEAIRSGFEEKFSLKFGDNHHLLNH